MSSSLEIVSVIDFGAKCDGMTNDTPAIQAALDYCESIGGTELIFPKNKTVKISKAGTRSIWSWSPTGKKERVYGLLIPSNVSVNFNGCSLIAENEGTDTINMIENKNASVDLPRDSNIMIKNVTINQNIDIDTFPGNSIYDSCGICFQNIDNLILDNVTVLNTYMHGIRIIEASHVELRNKVHVKSCIGCNFRMGWDNYPVIGSTVNLLICENSSNRLESYTPGNSLYINNCKIVEIREYRQFTSDPIAYVGSVNICNNNEHIYLKKVYSYDTGFKIQDYSSNGTNQAFNVHISDMVIEGNSGTPIFYIMGFRVKIDNLYAKNLGAFWISNGKYTEFGSAYFDNCKFVVKGNLAKETHFQSLFLYNSTVAFQVNGGLDVASIGHLTVRWDASTNTGAFLKLVDIQCKAMTIGSIVYKLDGSIASGGHLGSLLACSPTTNEFLKVGKAIDLNNMKQELITITLFAGTSTTINLESLNIWRDSWLNRLDVDLIPVNPASTVVIYNTYINHPNGETLKINHSTSSGTEQFRLVVNEYGHIKMQKNGP